ETRSTRRARSAVRRMRSIDVHTHLLPPELPRWSEKFGYGGFIRLERKDACTARMIRDDGTFFRDVTANVWDPDTRIAECDAPEVFPVFARAAELGCPVFVHPWDMMGQERMQKYWLPWLVGMPAEGAQAIASVIFGGVLERLPSLRLCFAHGGGAFAFTFARIQHGFESRPDLCGVDNPRPPREYLGRFWVDSLVHDALALRLVLTRFGEDKVVVGSDYPF